MAEACPEALALYCDQKAKEANDTEKQRYQAAAHCIRAINSHESLRRTEKTKLTRNVFKVATRPVPSNIGDIQGNIESLKPSGRLGKLGSLLESFVQIAQKAARKFTPCSVDEPKFQMFM